MPERPAGGVDADHERGGARLYAVVEQQRNLIGRHAGDGEAGEPAAAQEQPEGASVKRLAQAPGGLADSLPFRCGDRRISCRASVRRRCRRRGGRRRGGWAGWAAWTGRLARRWSAGRLRAWSGWARASRDCRSACTLGAGRAERLGWSAALSRAGGLARAPGVGAADGAAPSGSSPRSSGRRRMKMAAAGVRRITARAASTSQAVRQLDVSERYWISGTVKATLAALPIRARPVARPRWRTNQLATAVEAETMMMPWKITRPRP